MNRRAVEFISSFGLMLLGVGGLAVGTLAFGYNSAPRLALPRSLPRLAFEGGLESLSTTTAALPASHPVAPRPRRAVEFTVPLSAAAAVVVDDATGEILFAKNERLSRPLASITKLMSALVLNDLPLDWSSTTTVTEADSDESSHNLAVGDQLSLAELLQAALVGSSNSAVGALVRASGLSEAEFVARMNARAAAGHYAALAFTEPTGLSSQNVGTAIDAARLLRAAIAEPRLAAMLGSPSVTVVPLGQRARLIWSTDRLLTNWVPNDFLKSEIKGKTGFTDEAGYNFVVRLSAGSARAVRVVILGAADSAARFTEARDLAEWVFREYLWP